jgi:hypothetical protein
MKNAELWHGTERHVPFATDSSSAKQFGADSGGTSNDRPKEHDLPVV